MITIGAFLLVGAFWIWRARHVDRHVHDWQLVLTTARIYLCCSCGAHTPGWDLFTPPPGTQRFATRGSRS